MSRVPSLSQGQIERLAHLLSGCGTGTEISSSFAAVGLVDRSGESTKWRRISSAFLSSQAEERCANKVLDFIQTYLAPVRFVGKNTEFEAIRGELNAVLAFSGLEYGADGAFRQKESAKTVPEAERRWRTLHAKLQGRSIHAEVLKYCRIELLQENYFHAVFEASKGLAQRIRDLSGVQADGAGLIDQVFSVDRPLLAFNTLRTETERSEHKGLAALLKGCFAAVRNPLAHEPKILWEGEDDAADYLSLISLLHRRLDHCVSTQPSGGSR